MSSGTFLSDALVTGLPGFAALVEEIRDDAGNSAEDERVQVIVRCRPISKAEIEAGFASVVDVVAETKSIDVRVRPGTSAETISNLGAVNLDLKRQNFPFDACYDERNTQTEIYNQSFRPIVDSVLSGYNGTIFAYGQTGTGKTFTMNGISGDEELEGVIPRAIKHIFNHIDETEGTQFIVRASYLELYQEVLRDLLQIKNIGGRKTLTVCELRENEDGPYVKSLSGHLCTNTKQMLDLMKKGNKNRAVGRTNMNEHSSRSHAIFIVQVEQIMNNEWSKKPAESKEKRMKVGKLNLVDLAGSERISKSGATGERFKEATKINLSLSALGNVISALTDGKSSHVPYRDSKLTRLLQDSLGGNSRTVMIATIGPADFNWDETISTLKYAARAKNIRNKPKMNELLIDILLREALAEILILRAELDRRLAARSIRIWPENRFKEIPTSSVSSSSTLPAISSDTQHDRNNISAFSTTSISDCNDNVEKAGQKCSSSKQIQDGKKQQDHVVNLKCNLKSQVEGTSTTSIKKKKEKKVCRIKKKDSQKLPPNPKTISSDDDLTYLNDSDREIVSKMGPILESYGVELESLDTVQKTLEALEEKKREMEDERAEIEEKEKELENVLNLVKTSKEECEKLAKKIHWLESKMLCNGGGKNGEKANLGSCDAEACENGENGEKEQNINQDQVLSSPPKLTSSAEEILESQKKLLAKTLLDHKLELFGNLKEKYLMDNKIELCKKETKKGITGCEDIIDDIKDDIIEQNKEKKKLKMIIESFVSRNFIKNLKKRFYYDEGENEYLTIPHDKRDLTTAKGYNKRPNTIKMTQIPQFYTGDKIQALENVHYSSENILQLNLDQIKPNSKPYFQKSNSTPFLNTLMAVAFEDAEREIVIDCKKMSRKNSKHTGNCSTSSSARETSDDNYIKVSPNTKIRPVRSGLLVEGIEFRDISVVPIKSKTSSSVKSSKGLHFS